MISVNTDIVRDILYLIMNLSNNLRIPCRISTKITHLSLAANPRTVATLDKFSLMYI